MTLPIDKTIDQLGYAGLLPFVGLTVLLWLVRADLLPFVAVALTGYAAVIASFLGGIHWGIGFLHAPRDPLHNSGEAVAVGSGWAARRLFAANSTAIGKKSNAADRPSPADRRPQGVMQRAPRAPRFHFVWGVVPSLLAWLALLMPAYAGLPLLGLTLLACYAVDRKTYPSAGLSRWLPLRLRLTVVATLSCVLGAAAI